MKTTVLGKNDIQIDQKEQFALDVLTGFSSNPKVLSPKYFYDDLGSELFQKITQQEDYYLTRTEYSILNDSKDRLPDFVNEDEIDIIELGAGDGHKSDLVIQGFLDSGKKVNFYPIDISKEAMNQLAENIKARENLEVHGVVAEYLEGLRFLRKQSKNRQLVLFLGSNIGNFDRVQREVFLRKVWRGLNKDDLILLGLDLKKDVNIVAAAYNDKEGITRHFNLNLLDRINRELGANFKTDAFQHVGLYNPFLGAMESHLLSRKEQTVHVEALEKSFHFDAFETLHLEYSFKFSKKDINLLASSTGFVVQKHLSDKDNYFIDSLWKVEKDS